MSDYPAPRPPFCHWVPVEGTLRHDGLCPQCGHYDMVHIGVEHCPVCELAYMATREFWRQQARIHGGSRSGAYRALTEVKVVRDATLEGHDH